MNERDSGRLVIAGYIVAISVLVGAAALCVIAAIRIDWDNTSMWLLLVVQVLIALLTSIGIIIFAAVVVVVLSNMVENHAEGVKTVAERTPTLAAAMVLGAEAVRVFADKSFEGEQGPTIFLSLFLLIGFGIANHLALSGKKFRKYLGIGMWYVSALIYPLFYLWDHQWKFDDVISVFSSLDLSTRVILVLAGIIIIFLPIVAFPRRNQDANQGVW